jgi:uncharacterized membrane protein
MATVAAPARRARSQSKLILFVLFALVTVFVTYMKNARVLDPTSPIAQHFAPAKWVLLVHALFGSIALALGPLQFSNRLRARNLKLHRISGYVYVVGVFIAAPLGIPIAARVDTLSLVFASGVQALGWAGCTAIALYCVLHGNIAEHRRWMIRGYPFAAVFTFARVVIGIPAVQRLGWPGIESVVWTGIALAAFLPNIILEWPAITGSRRAMTRSTSAAD